MTIEEKLQKIELDLKTYEDFLKDPIANKEERNLVSFKVLYELMAFAALKEFVPDFKPKHETEFSMATGLKNVNNLVSIIEGKVVISHEYQTILQQKADFLKRKNTDNG